MSGVLFVSMRIVYTHHDTQSEGGLPAMCVTVRRVRLCGVAGGAAVIAGPLRRAWSPAGWRACASAFPIKWQLLPVLVVGGTLSAVRRCAMQSMNISLPDPLKQFVDGQIAQGRYSSVSEYVRELIRADEKRKAEEQLEAKLLEGLSGAESELTPADWSVIRREALAKVEARKKPR